MNIDISDAVEEIIKDYFEEVGLLPNFRSTQIKQHCIVCGEELEQNLCYRGNPNGFKTHGLANCIQNFRSRIEELESK